MNGPWPRPAGDGAAGRPRGPEERAVVGVREVVAECAVCRDRLVRHATHPCGRCQRVVCRACSRLRGRSHESVLCRDCAGAPRPLGFHATPLYRSWRRLLGP